MDSEIEIKLIDGDTRNIRGPKFSTADLDESISQSGIITPLLLRIGVGERFVCVDGHRRLRVAKKAGLTTVPAVVRSMTDEEAQLAMMQVGIVSTIPYVVLDNTGHIVAGKALAIAGRVDGGMRKGKLAAMMDITPDTVGACCALCTEPPLVLERVANGDMDITVYSRMKTQPKELKLYIMENTKGTITADRVRNVIRDWDNIWGAMTSSGLDDEDYDDNDEFDDDELGEGKSPAKTAKAEREQAKPSGHWAEVLHEAAVELERSKLTNLDLNTIQSVVNRLEGILEDMTNG